MEPGSATITGGVFRLLGARVILVAAVVLAAFVLLTAF